MSDKMNDDECMEQHWTPVMDECMSCSTVCEILHCVMQPGSRMQPLLRYTFTFNHTHLHPTTISFQHNLVLSTAPDKL